MSKGTFIQITADDTSADACDWALMLLRMYRMWAERKNLSVDILHYESGPEAGLREAVMLFSGDNTYNRLRNETGIHSILRPSPFDGIKQLNSASVVVYERSEKHLIPTPWIRWGHGDTPTGVYIEFDGIKVKCDHSRDLMQNGAMGIDMLSGLLYRKESGNKLDKIRQFILLGPRDLGSRYGVWSAKERPELLTREVTRILNGEIDELLR